MENELKLLGRKSGIGRTGVGLVVIALAFIVTVLRELVGDFQISGAELHFILVDTVVFIFCSYVVFFVMWRDGKEHGRGNDDYKTARKALLETIDRIKPRSSELTQFCTDYVKQEAERIRRGILELADVDYEKYLKEYRGRGKKDLPSGLSKQEIRAIRAADRVKPMTLTKTMLLTEPEKITYRNRIVHPSVVERGKITALLARVSVSSAFAAQIGVHYALTENPAEALLTALWRSFLLLWWCFSTYRKGVSYETSDVCTYMQFQTEVLEEFEKWIIPSVESTTDVHIDALALSPLPEA